MKTELKKCEVCERTFASLYHNAKLCDPCLVDRIERERFRRDEITTGEVYEPRVKLRREPDDE